MNRYERNLMLNVTLMKIFYVCLVLVNILLPVQRNTFFSTNLLQIIVVIVWFFGLLGGMGYFDQMTPVLPIGIVRFVELIYYGFLKEGYLNWIAFVIYVGLDIIYMTFLFFDKAGYEYKKEEDISNGDATYDKL